MDESQYEPRLPAAVQEMEDEADAFMKEATAPEESEETAVIEVVEKPQEEAVEDWQAKYEAEREAREKLSRSHEVLRGKYDTEVAPLTRKVNSLEHKLAEAEEAEKVPVTHRYTTEEQRDVMEEDVLKGVEGVSKAMAEDLVNPVRDQVKQLASDLRDSKFESALSEMVPDWRDIDRGVHRDAWLAWLGQSVPMTGSTRDAFLQQAHGRLDVDTVAGIFNQFKTDQGINGSTPTASEASPLPKLEDQVVPKAAGGGRREPSPQHKLQWSQYEAHTEKMARNKRYRESGQAQKVDDMFDEAFSRGEVEGVPDQV